MCQENGKRRTWTEKRGCVYDGVCVYRQTSVIDGRVFTGVCTRLIHVRVCYVHVGV